MTPKVAAIASTPSVEAVHGALDRYFSRTRAEALEGEASLRLAWVMRSLAAQGIVVDRSVLRSMIDADLRARRLG